MKAMLRLQNATHVVFFPIHKRGWAEDYRKDHPEYRYKRIVEVIQARPDLITFGEPLERR